MASNDDAPPLSLRPFPVAGKEPRTLADFICRVNQQPGGFRGLTETKLRDEIRAGEDSDNATPPPEDVDMVDAADDDDAASKDPAAARMEVLKNVECV